MGREPNASSLARDVAAGLLSADDINENMLSSRMSLADKPVPDLCIRTGGEWRFPTFSYGTLLAELWFTDTLWRTLALMN